MATYPFRCVVCHLDQDHIIEMELYLAGTRQPCERCGGRLDRVIVPVGEVGTGNTMHRIVDSALEPGHGAKVYNTRREWEAAMKRVGVRPMERGDAEAQAKNEARRYHECRARYEKQLGERVDKAIDRAMQERGGQP